MELSDEPRAIERKILSIIQMWSGELNLNRKAGDELLTDKTFFSDVGVRSWRRAGNHAASRPIRTD